MSNPTSNFNWQMPTATDLVTDLPADFEVFGQAVDSSMADLLGGTTGQILAKNSNTNMDFVWITNDVGDITAVTAGTGISGGGTSGAVTITNSMATEITAKGDLIVGTGNATFDNLPAGTNGHVLTADSTVSPSGLKWAAPAAGGKVLQVVSTTYTTEATSTSVTYADSGLTLSITPTSATSKILALVNFATGSTRNAAYAASKIRFMRDSTEIVVMGGGTHNQAIYFEGNTMTYTLIRDIFSFNYLDSPATTSAVAYKVQFAVGQQPGGPTVTSYAQPDSNRSILTLMEIGA